MLSHVNPPPAATNTAALNTTDAMLAGKVPLSANAVYPTAVAPPSSSANVSHGGTTNSTVANPTPTPIVQPHTKRLREEDIQLHDEAMRRLSGGGYGGYGLYNTHGNHHNGGGGGGGGINDSPPAAAAHGGHSNHNNDNRTPAKFANLRVTPNAGMTTIAPHTTNDNDDTPNGNNNDDGGEAPLDNLASPTASSFRGGGGGARTDNCSIRATEGGGGDANISSLPTPGSNVSSPTSAVDGTSSAFGGASTTAVVPTSGGEENSNGSAIAAAAVPIAPKAPAAIPTASANTIITPTKAAATAKTALPPTPNVHIKSRAGGGGIGSAVKPAAASSAAGLPLKILTPHHHAGGGGPTTATAPNGLNTSASANNNNNNNKEASSSASALLSSSSAAASSSSSSSQLDRFTKLFEKALAEIVPVMSPMSPVAPERGVGGDGASSSYTSSTVPPALQQQKAACPPDASTLAKDIATELIAAAKDPSSRAKTLLFHLRDATNTELRNSLRKGRLTGKAFVHLDTFNELFNKAKQADVSAALTASDARHDYRLVSTKDTTASSLYECPVCRHKRHTLVQLQMRSGDEPMTELCNCLICGNTWRAAE